MEALKLAIIGAAVPSLAHQVILQGFEGTYHYEKLIFGTPKEHKDFLAAVYRWSRGAVQLFWLAVLGG